jgi:hypothetical protein
MSFNLNELSKPTGSRPIIATFYGEGGMGKTTLASMFPNPVIIRTEDGTASIQGNENVSMFPLARTVSEVFSAIESLATQDHQFKTLVLDSVTQLATMVEHEIVDNDPKAQSINQAGGGYGAGYAAASEKHRKIREWAGELAYHKGMNVIFIAHADTETMDLPDLDQYNRYTIRMNKKSIPHYTDNVDLVGLIRLKTIVTGMNDKKQARSNGDREILCFPQAVSVTKNRFGITHPIDFTLESGNPFAAFVQGGE